MKDISKLPKWVQVKIVRLQNDLEYTENRLKKFEGKKDTNTFIIHGLTEIPLPNNSEIKFSLGEGWHRKVTCKINDGEIEVFADSMLVLPKASNHVHIKLGR